MKHAATLTWESDHKLTEEERHRMQMGLRRLAFGVTGDNAEIDVDGDVTRYDGERWRKQ